MRNKSKYFTCLLISLLFVCIIQINTVNAAASPSLSASADTASVTEGGYVNVSVNLSSNPSISTLGIALNYDSSVLKYDSAAWSGGFSGSDMQMTSDTGSQVNLSVVCDSSYSADGTVVTVRFQAVKDSSSIPVTLALRDMADADLSAVSNCKVSSKVRVPETVDKKENTAEAKASGTGQGTDAAERESGQSEQQTVSVANVDTGSVQSASGSVTGNAAGTAASGAQSASAQNAKAATASEAGSAKPDQNYKTGAGLGNDILLVIAVACGILALLLAVGKNREEKH